jgi:hypothetical protein
VCRHGVDGKDNPSGVFENGSRIWSLAKVWQKAFRSRGKDMQDTEFLDMDAKGSAVWTKEVQCVGNMPRPCPSNVSLNGASNGEGLCPCVCDYNTFVMFNSILHVYSIVYILVIVSYLLIK